MTQKKMPKKYHFCRISDTLPYPCITPPHVCEESPEEIPTDNSEKKEINAPPHRSYAIQVALFTSKIADAYFSSSQINDPEICKELSTAIFNELKTIPDDKKNRYIELMRVKFNQHILRSDEQCILNLIKTTNEKMAIFNKVIKNLGFN